DAFRRVRRRSGRPDRRRALPRQGVDGRLARFDPPPGARRGGTLAVGGGRDHRRTPTETERVPVSTSERVPMMRTRLPTALSACAAAAVLLAGCASPRTAPAVAPGSGGPPLPPEATVLDQP